MPPLASGKADVNGYVTKNVLDHYNERTKGGYISLVIIEHCFVSNEGKASSNQLSIADDNTTEGLTKLVNLIHNNNTKVVIQINHAGSKANEKVTGYTPVGPSKIANPNNGYVPNELSISEIQNIQNYFVTAALRAKKAGADGVEIHSAHGYLINQFLSPLTNLRNDEFGGNINNRVKILLDIIKKVRNLVGYDFPIFVRLGACDYMDGGITVEDGVYLSKLLEKCGVDFLDISRGFSGYNIKGLDGEGFFSTLTEKIKKEVSIPIILTGGIKTAEGAEKLLCENKADLIGVGREILKNPLWAKNAIEKLI